MTALVGEVGAIVQGRSGRLFLGRQDGFDLGRFTDGSAMQPLLLAQWRAALLRRGRELSARGIPYVFMVVPDTPSIYQDDLPEQYAPPFRTPGTVFMEAMGDIPGVTFVHPVNAMREARGGLDVYACNDSHWTPYGSGVAYRELMARILPLRTGRVVPPSEVRFTHRWTYGDLGTLCDPELRVEFPVANFSTPEPERLLQRLGAQRQTVTVTRTPDAPSARVLVFRDSFMTHLAPYLARSFSDLFTVGTTARVMLDVVGEWGADLVISEVAERRLLEFQSDHQPHSFEWMYMTDYSGEHGRAMLRARNVMQADPAQAAAIVRGEGDRCLADPSHAYTAAIILDAAGDLGAATRFVDSVIESRPANAAALCLRARLALGAGQSGEAACLVQRAVEVAPWNGAYQELLVYALREDGRARQALDAAEAALLRIDDHAGLWYWAAILRNDLGYPDSALDAVNRALVLDPFTQAYVDLSASLAGRQ